MNTSFYDQLTQLLHTNPKLDIFNLYFLGICTEYASETTSLEWLLNQLPLNFPRLFEVFMGNKHEIGFISRTLLRIIHNIPQEDRSPSTQDIFDCERSEIEEDLKRILKDFELVRLLYPRVTKFQWFYFGTFMAKNRSFELLALLKGVYIDLLVRNYKYDEQGKVEFLAALLTEKYKPEILPPSSRAIRTGKIQTISNKLADLKRDLRSLVSMRNELDQKMQREEQETRSENSCTILPLARKEISNEEVARRQESRRRLVLRPRENLENKDPIMKEEPPRPKFTSIYAKESIGFMRRPLQNMDTNIGRNPPKVEPVKCSPLMMEIISPVSKLKIDLKETSEIESRIAKNIEAKSLVLKDARLALIIPQPRPFQECPICFDIGTLSTGVSLKLCKHFFHKSCLQEYFQTRINEKNFPIVCAMDGCNLQVLESEIIEALDQTYKDKFYSFSLKHFVESHKNEVFCCPTPNCEYFAFQDKVKKSFYCTTCVKAFCVDCQGEWHDGKTCEEMKVEDESLKKFNEYVVAKGCQQCPSCQYYIEKNEGCDHMTCRCGKEFCYSCLNNMEDCYCRRDEY